MANDSLPLAAKSNGKAVAIEAVAIDGIPVENELLLRLPAQEWEALFPRAVFVQFRRRDVLHEPAEPIKFAYFINSGLASVLSVMADGKSVEVGLTAKEGFVGLPLIVGFATSPTRTVIQIQGDGFRVSAAALVQLLQQCPTLEKRMQRYVQSLAMQASHVAACNQLHEVHERLARWLLSCQDRIDSSAVPLTHEFLAQILGTRRSSVTVAAGQLQKAGLITYRSGVVQIESRARLMQVACECYKSMRRQAGNWRSEASPDGDPVGTITPIPLFDTAR